jgi:hypothetical protein
MYYVSMFCDRALWLDRGRIQQVGPAKEVVEAYESYLQTRDTRRIERGSQEAQPASDGAHVGRLTALRLVGRDGDDPLELEPGGSLEVELEVASSRADERYQVGVALNTLDGRSVLAVATSWDGWEPLTGHDSYRVRLTVPELPLAIGTFHLYGFLFDESGLHIHDQVVATDAVRVRRQSWTPSLLEVPHRWERR